VVEPHVATEARRRHAHQESVVAETFRDSVGVGSYRIDLHPCTGGVNYIDISSLPFQIPLGALIPCRIENLLLACKNLGTTHITNGCFTNGCFRLHPVEWAIGEAAGALVAFCLESRLSPAAVRNTPGKLAAFQSRLTEQEVELAWPKVLPR
jgi:FAD dependent oxidoreductase